ncbi:MAG: type II secretion system F family protein [Candidatus Bathyarchaeota archaeon]|jgi:flagellar protein FlaJ
MKKISIIKKARERALSIAYQMMGARIDYILPLFKDLGSNLNISGIKVNLKAYVSLAALVTVITSTIVSIIIPCILTIFNIPIFPAILFGIGGGLFDIAFSTIGFYVYPLYKADKHKRELEEELPFTTGYMAILANAGVSPENTFQSISNLRKPFAISRDAENIVREVNLFGSDIISAIQKTSKWTPSERFRELMEGLISTIHSGGNLPRYLQDRSNEFMKLKRISLKKHSDTLSILSEFYVALLVTGPLLMVIMLTVMSMLGGGVLGVLSPDLLLSLLTYLVIPIGSIMFLIILDIITPTG